MTITFIRQKDQGQSYYYSLHDRQKSLFADFILVAIWGKEIAKGREKVYTFKTQKEMDIKVRKIFKQRIQQGYKVLYSFARKEHEKNLVNQIQEFRIG